MLTTFAQYISLMNVVTCM